jgi:antitoxin component YwqK of YwqJK toxin-antitoxin module
MKQDKAPKNKQSQPHGYWESYYLDGQLWFKGNYINGKKDGWWESYWRNGQLCYKGNCINGKRDGWWECYWSDGQLWHKGNYINGKRDGLWIENYYKKVDRKLLQKTRFLFINHK